MLVTKRSFIFSKQNLLSLIPLLLVLTIPASGQAATTATSASKIETLGSVLAQADHFRIRGKTPEQFKQALSLYQYAADDGIAVAQYWLGVMHFEGKGTERDIDKATHWVHLSAKQAYPPAEELLSEIMQGAEDEDEC